jgi:hypothetical protein
VSGLLAFKQDHPPILLAFGKEHPLLHYFIFVLHNLITNAIAFPPPTSTIAQTASGTFYPTILSSTTIIKAFYTGLLDTNVWLGPFA